MRRKLAIAGVLLSAGFIFPLTASAQEFNHTITVYAVVPEQRAIYLNEFGAIVRIAGNTTRNVTPKVYDSSIHEVSMAPVIQQQYDDFLKQHGGKLEASKVYYINPLKVNADANQQQLSVLSLAVDKEIEI